MADEPVPTEESYTHLKQRVAELTRDLHEAIEQQVATNEVLQVIGRSTFDHQPVFETVRPWSRMLPGFVKQRVG